MISPTSPPHVIDELDTRILRLETVRDWIKADKEFAQVVDAAIAQRVRKSEARQFRLNIVLNVIFLLAGWALSLLITPNMLGNLFGH
jgi:hypothetical protein